MKRMVREIEGNFGPVTARFAILVARFNSAIVEGLLDGAIDTLRRHGVSEDNIVVVRVPGAYELPVVAKKVAARDDIDAVIALGAVIRGATPHFDFVAGQCAAGLSTVALDSGKPVGFGVLTTDTIEQAVESAGTKAGNKGADVAMTALEMVSVLRQLDD